LVELAAEFAAELGDPAEKFGVDRRPFELAGALARKTAAEVVSSEVAKPVAPSFLRAAAVTGPMATMA